MEYLEHYSATFFEEQNDLNYVVYKYNNLDI